MIKKIIVPYDYSKPAENALSYAIDLVKSMKEQQQELILLHVVNLSSYSTGSFSSRRIQSPKTGDMITLEQYLKDTAIDIKIDAKKTLEDKIKKIKSNGFSIKGVVLSGDPTEEILKFSELENIDLIVMGNVGLKGISKIKTLGSVSRKVIENSIRPVLIIH
ncbi:MAG: universal stress protein [Nitrososphaeraceae archaeon]|nr:universal stress protein [Nitrososphaeraceae archaeon]